MKKYVARRLLQLIPILLAITFLSFGMMRLAGSDTVLQKMENTGAVVSQEARTCRRYFADMAIARVMAGRATL